MQNIDDTSDTSFPLFRPDVSETPAEYRFLLIKIVGKDRCSKEKVLGAIRSGLKFECLEILSENFKMSLKEVLNLLLINPSAMVRRRASGFLAVDESDRVVRFVNIFDIAVKLFDGNKAQALKWLKSPSAMLDNHSALYHSQTEIGARDVEQLCGRIQHGIFC